MPKAIPIPTTNRRHLLAGAAATLVAGAAIASARAEPPVLAPSPDAELITICTRLVEIRRETDALYDTDAEAERRTQPALDALHTEQEAILKRIEALPSPRTMAGAKAVAAAARSLLLKDIDGNQEHANDAEWLAFTALEFVEGQRA